MSLVPGSRFPSYPHQGPEYYPPKHMGAMHLSVFVYVSSTPAVVVKNVDDYGSLFSVNLAGGSVAGSASAYGNVPQGGAYGYGVGIAAGATLGSMTFAGSPYGLTYAYTANFEVADTGDTVVEHVQLFSGGTVGNEITVATGAAAGAQEYFSGWLGAYISYSGGSGSYTNNIAKNNIATTGNCAVTLITLSIFVVDFIPGPGTVGETW